MSYLAINLSQELNGVSRLHGKVTQKMFAGLWKGYTYDENYVGYVTNGVHLQTWTSDAWIDLYKNELDSDFLVKESDREMWKKIYRIHDGVIWKLRNSQREKLIEYIKERIRIAMAKRLEPPRRMMESEEKFNSRTLTIGFARRFAAYKRAGLLFPSGCARPSVRMTSSIN